MDASAWIAIGSLAFVVFAQAIALAFMFGALFNRVKVLEAKPAAADCKADLELLTYKFEEMRKSLEGIAGDVRNLLTAKPANVRRVGSQ